MDWFFVDATKHLYSAYSIQLHYVSQQLNPDNDSKLNY